MSARLSPFTTMKIIFFSADPGNHRFVQPIIDRLQAKGHDCHLYNNWTAVPDADVYWFDFVDNNLIVATREDYALLAGKKVIARLHAVEAYVGHYKSVDWKYVDTLIYVSDHIRRKCGDIEYPVGLKRVVIHNGIDLSTLTYRERKLNAAKYVDNWNFGYVGNIVPQKGLLTFIHYFSTACELEPKAEFHLAGLSRMSGREGEYWDHAKAQVGNVFEEGPTENVDAWLDEKRIHVLVQPSYAESFSLIIAEAMAKGIKVAINNFWGAEELWPTDMIYSNFAEFGRILEAPYESRRYREWVEERYDINKIITQIEQCLN